MHFERERVGIDTLQKSSSQRIVCSKRRLQYPFRKLLFRVGLPTTFFVISLSFFIRVHQCSSVVACLERKLRQIIQATVAIIPIQPMMRTACAICVS